LKEINEDVLNSIREKADIVDVIQRYIPVIKKGKNYTAVCPFHDDHTPSLSINLDKQIFKCFVCQTGGNVFGFVKEYEKTSFIEAVRKVAQYINFPLEDNQFKKVDTTPSEFKQLYALLEEYITYTQYILNTVEAAPYKKYLLGRSIAEEQIKKFQIGLNLENKKSTDFLLAKGFTVQQCVSSNIARINEYGPQDVFHDRIVFPIHDYLGNPVGFSGRTLNPEEPSKYINSSETIIYSKGKLLYNYHRALPFIKRSNQLILVEGVTDVIAFDRAGIFNVIATLGTACTSDQVRLIQQASLNIVLSYDGDEAGRNAAYKIGKLLVKYGLHVEVVNNTTGLDPDEITQKQSIQSLKDLLNNRLNFAEFVYNYLLGKFDLNNYSQKKEFAKLMIEEIQGIQDKFDQSVLMDKLLNSTQFSIEQLNMLNPKAPIKVNVTHKPKLNREIFNIKDWAELEILGQMLYSNRAAQHFFEDLGFLPTKGYNQCALLIKDYYYTHDTIIVANLLNIIDDEETQRIILELSTNQIYYRPYTEQSFKDAINQVKIIMIDTKISGLKELNKNSLDETEREKNLDLINSLHKQKDSIKNGGHNE